MDLKVWIEYIEEKNKYFIMYENYIDVSTRQVINANAAFSWSDKRRILTQQCLKIMLNCKNLPWATITNHLSYFSKRMQASGYKHKFRFEIIKSGVDAYEKINKEVNRGLRPLRKKKEWKYIERKIKKQKQRKEWHKKDGTEAVLFIPNTPDSKLAKLIRNRIEQSNLRVKVIEKSGKKVKELLQKGDPLADSTCHNKECFVCSTNKQGGCRNTSVTYSLKCIKEGCNFSYKGQTGKNRYSRGDEHLEDYRKKEAFSVMWKHCQKQHLGIK